MVYIITPLKVGVANPHVAYLKLPPLLSITRGIYFKPILQHGDLVVGALIGIIVILINLDGSREIPSDPNVNKNRIPEATDLNTLRNLVQCNLRLIKRLDIELEQRQKDRAAIQKRYEEQLQVLEGIQSELLVMNSFMEMLEKQKEVM